MEEIKDIRGLINKRNKGLSLTEPVVCYRQIVRRLLTPTRKLGKQVARLGFWRINVFPAFPISNSGCNRHVLKIHSFVLFYLLFFKFKSSNCMSLHEPNNLTLLANYELI